MASPPELNVIACQRCRRKKLKCDREKPVCKRCSSLSVECIYEPPQYGKRKRPVHSTEDSSIPGILNRLHALESAVSRPNSHSASAPPFPSSSLKGYRFHTDAQTEASDASIFIPSEAAISWIQTLYNNQPTLGLLLPISKDFMLAIPPIIDSPYVQIDVRVLILYYGALHHGMLLSPGLTIQERNRYALFFYRKTLRLMEQWLLQDQTNELSLHVAFWMTHEAYTQLDFDLAHRLHRSACQIAGDLGLLQLDAETGPSSLSEISQLAHPSTIYKDVHRIYFWHILISTDYIFQHHLYRSGTISGPWKVGLPDLSKRQSLSDIARDTEVYFEASLRLSLIELEYSQLDGMSENEAKLVDLVWKVDAVLEEWQIEHLMEQTSRVNAWLYAQLIWRTTAMITSFLRGRGNSSLKDLEYKAAQRSIRALQRMLEFDQDGLYWNLG
ncbi:hypothetical protein BDV18DRAFT_162183 [Aspergillus unguis]